MRQVIGFGVSMFLRNGLMMLGALVMLFATSPKLAAFIVLGVPATLIPILIMGRRVRRLSRVNQDRVADVRRTSTNRCTKSAPFRHIGTKSAPSSASRARQKRRTQAGVDRIRVKAWLISLVMLIGFCAVGVILWIGGHDVFEGRLTAGELSAFVFYAAIVAASAGVVSEVWGEIQRAAGATERLMELLDVKSALVVGQPAIRLPARVTGAIRFDDVRFAYPTRLETTALGPVSFTIHPGERVALVGPSGAGKSTVFALILRFYDPSAGRVLIDGADIRYCDPRELRGAVALVPQEPVIFAASVLENVRFGRPGGDGWRSARSVRRGAGHGIHRAPAARHGHRSWASAG